MTGGTRTTAEPNCENARPREALRLREALDAAAGGGSRIIELSGDPGSGKTRLLVHMMAEADRRGLDVAHIRYTEFEQRLPYRAFSTLLSTPPLNALLAGMPADDRRLIERVILRRPGAGGRAAPGTWNRFRVSMAVRELLSGAATGLVVVLEDFHWADSESVELVDHLLRRPPAGPLLLVIAQRPRQAPSRLRGTLAHCVELGAVSRIELPPLSPADSGRLLGLPPDDPRLAELHRAGHGNPLYLTALAADPAAGDIGEPCGGGAPAGLPAQIAGLLLGEVTSLNERAALVAASAAVLGEHCDLDSLAAVSELDRSEVEDAVDTLLARDILRTCGHRMSFRFRHPILRRAVYDDSGSTWRLWAHRRALAVLAARGTSATALAVHVERSSPHAGAGGLAILTEAAREVLLTDPGRAAHLLETALRTFSEAAPEPRERVELQLQLLLSRALGLAGRLPESRDLLHRVMRTIPADDPAQRASAAEFCALIESLLGHFTEARALLDEAVAGVLALPDPPREAATLLVARGMIGAFDGQAPSRDQVGFAAELARRYDDRVAEAGVLVLRGLCDAFDRIAESRGSLAAAAAAVNRLSDAELAPHPEYLGVLGCAETVVGLFQDAERHFTRGMGMAYRDGQYYVLPALMIGLGNAYRHTRTMSDARRIAREARELAARNGSEHLCGLALALEALTAVWGGDGRPDESLQLAERALSALTAQDFYWSVTGVISLAIAASAAGDHLRCITLLLEAGGGPDLGRIPGFLRPMCFSLMIVPTVITGGSAESWAVRAEKAATGLDLPSPLAYAHFARSVMLREKGDFAAAAVQSQEAADLFATAGMPHSKAWMLTVTADNLTVLGRCGEAQSTLALAKELGRRCGGVRVLENARRQEMHLASMARQAITPPPLERPSPPRPERSAPRVDLSTLTDREREIAMIAGTGLKTREIAARLSLSPRTVDAHLTRIYRKLNIRSRAVLARLMAETG